MAQVGRISGPLLQENLLRNGIDLSFETDLIYLDVTNQRIGIKTTSPTNEIQNSETTRTTNLIVDTEANFPILNFTNSNIQPFGGTNNIILDSAYRITASNIKTGDIFIDDNYISTTESNSPLEFYPNGTGNVNIFNKLWVDGDINLDGENFNVDGNIQFGDANTDSLTFNADINSNIVPDVSNFYNLGSADKRWKTIHSKFLNGGDIDAQVALLGTVSLGTTQGKIWYVSTNGDNAYVGDHQQGPFRTLDYAVTQAQSGDTILVMPGEYEETCPIVVPQGVTIRGLDIRNTIIKPPSSDNYVDIFKLNGETAVSDLTVKDFYYDSVNDVGYAFRFADNATVTTRSPYIQNISVITAGSVTSADDPRGFAQGDAGKGALVDGADVLNTSEEASMLFHSVTFITPGVDALTMTNGVRVEWLNSFTYFANRGLYAVDGATGHLSTDGSTVKYGAELRSIGSATVYGTYGAVADGADTLMYLIQHNVGYVGSGKFADNDPSRTIQANEIVKLNNGEIYYQTVNHFGDFRIGENFFINQETGESSIVIDSSEVQGFGRLRVTDVNTGNVTLVDGEQISTGNFTFSGNLIETATQDFNIASAGGEINLQDNTNVTGDVDITGNLTFDGQLNLMGNEATDTLKFNVSIDQDFNPNTDLTFDLGSNTKRWNNVWTTESQIGDIHIEDNFITTDVSNANLELRANGTGEVYVPSNDVQVDNNFRVSDTTNLRDTSVTGLVTQDGLLDVTGNWTTTNLTITGDIDVGSQNQFEEILIDGNVITTTTSNANLELRASGTGKIVINEQVDILNNLTFSDLTETGLITVTNTVSFDTANVSSVTLQGNRFYANTGNDLDLSSTGNVRVGSTDVIIENSTTVNGSTDIDDLTINGVIIQTGNKTQTGNYTLFGEFDNSNILIEDNFVTTTESNSNLELRANGTGEVVIDTNDTVTINNDLTVGGVLEYQGFLTINGNVILKGNVQDGSLTVTEDFNITGNLDVTSQAQFEEILIDDNFITTTSSNADLELRANGSGTILVPSNDVRVNNDMSAGTIDSVDVDIFGDLVFDEMSVTDANVTVNDNYITTETSNADLELRANGTGEVVVPSNDVTLEQNLTVNSDTNITDTDVSGTITHIGNRTQTGNYTLTGDITVSGDFAIADQPFQFEDILIDGNVVTTTLSNSNLDLRANGSSIVNFEANVSANRNFTVNDINVQNIVTNNNFSLENMVSSTDIEIFDNVITTTNSNSNLELRASGTGFVALQDILVKDNTISTLTDTLILQNANAVISATGSMQIPNGSSLQRIELLPEQVVDGGDADDILTEVYDGGDATTVYTPADLQFDAGIALVPSGNQGDFRFNTDFNLFEGFSQFNQYFGGVYSEDTRTSIVAQTDNTVDFRVNNIKVGELNVTELEVTGLDINDISIRNGLIKTVDTDLLLTPDGTGVIKIGDVRFDDNKILNDSVDDITFQSTTNGYYKVDSTGAFVMPKGSTAEHPTAPQEGQFRWNTDDNQGEIYNGTQWIPVAGVLDAVTAAEFEVILDEYVLIFG